MKKQHIIIIGILATVILFFGIKQAQSYSYSYSNTVVYTNYLFPIDNNMFGLSYMRYMNATIGNAKKFRIFNANGTAISNVITLQTGSSTSTTAGQYQVSGTALTNDKIIVAWHDGADATLKWAGYYINGTNYKSAVTVLDGTNNQYTIIVTRLTNNSFIASFWDRDNGDASYLIYQDNGTVLLSIQDLDDSVGTKAESVECARLTDTTFTCGWYDSTDGDITYGVYQDNGTVLLSPVDVDTDVGTTTGAFSMSIDALSSTRIVLGYFDATDSDASVCVYDTSGNAVLNCMDVDTDVGTSRAIQVRRVTDTTFGVIWTDDTDDDISMATLDTSGNYIRTAVDIETTALVWSAPSIVSQRLGGTGLCSDRMVVAWSNTTNGRWKAYDVNGTVWDGNCPDEGTPPVIEDSCNCTDGTLWMVNLSDHCEIIDDCDTNGGAVTFFGTGNFTLDTNIVLNTSDITFNFSIAPHDINLRDGATWNIIS